MRKFLDNIPVEYRTFFGVACLFHLFLIMMLTIAFSMSPKMLEVPTHSSVKIIQASVISRSSYEKQLAQKRANLAQMERQAEEQKARQLAKIKRERALEHAQLARKKADEQAKLKKEKRLKAEKAKLAKRQKARQLAREKAKALHAFKAQTQAAKIAVKKAAQHRALTIKQKYIGLIQEVIRSNWINQLNPPNPLQVTLKIYLDRKGGVQSVSVAKSSGNSAFDRQAMVAVEKSSPLPVPKDAAIAKDFSVITLPFTSRQVTE